MTDEQRLDRMERIVKLLIKAGVRARQQAREQAREQNEKINILIEMQMRNEDLFAKNYTEHEARLRKNEETVAKNEKRLAALSAKTDKRLEALAAKMEENFTAMTAAEARTEDRLNSFMEAVERLINERRNGRP